MADSSVPRSGTSAPMRLTDNQARMLLQLSAGYVIASTKDRYAALRKKGLVQDSDVYVQGDIEYRRANGRVQTSLTQAGRTALLHHVEKYGRLEIEFRGVLCDYSTVIRMDPKGDR